MIKTELLNNGTLIRHYSDDETKELLQVETGVRYGDAVDVNPCPYTYEEVDKPVEELENDNENE